MNPVVVFRAFNPAEAQLVCSLLKSAGLNAEVTQELATLSLEGYSMASGGVRVIVPAEQAAEARALIESKQGDADTPEEMA